MNDPVQWGQTVSVRQAIEEFNNNTTKLSKRVIFLNYILIILTVVLVFLTFVMIFQPNSSRYQFDKIEARTPGAWYEQKSGYIVKDTATGRIYEWVSFLPNEESTTMMQRSIVIDPINNKAVSTKQSLD